MAGDVLFLWQTLASACPICDRMFVNFQQTPDVEQQATTNFLITLLFF